MNALTLALAKRTKHDSSSTAGKYRDKARARYHVPGELEISQVAEVNRTNTGAWILCYVFIPQEDLTP